MWARRRGKAVGSLVLGIALAGCGTQAPSTPVSPSGAPRTTAATTGPTTAPTTAPNESPTPFGTRPALPLDPRNKGSKVVSFPASDDLTLSGREYGSGPHAVVLAPSGNVRYTQFEWLAAAAKLAKAGYHVLTFNVRGICYTPDPNVGCSEGDIDWANAWLDVAGAVEFMRDQGAKTVVVMGADLGGSEALYANAQGTAMDGIITVSGLEESEGYIIGKPVLDETDAPKLFIAGRDDEEAFQAYTDWMRDAPPPKDGLLLDTETRGTFIFDPIAPSEIALGKQALKAVEQFLASID
jgi:pimeloyl-ACP methyl ester carboxylesterase